MFQYVIKRILIFIPTLFAISLVVFLLTLYAPGDPVENMLVVTGGTQDGSISDKLAGEKTYLEMRKRLNLHLPTFYFTLSSQAYPDTLYKIPRYRHRVSLNRLIDKYGNWGKIEPYYHSIQQLELATIGTPKDSLNQRALIKIKSNLNTLYNYHQDKKITRALDSIQTYVNATTSTRKLLPVFGSLKANYQAVKMKATPQKKYIPKLTYHGIQNQYHTWLFGNRPWFITTKSILEEPLELLTTSGNDYNIPLEAGKYYKIQPKFKITSNQGKRSDKAVKALDLLKVTINGKTKQYSIDKLNETPIILYWDKENSKLPIKIAASSLIHNYQLQMSYDMKVQHLVNYDPDKTAGGFLRFDFGRSYQDKRPISTKIGEAIYWTMLISIISILLTYLIAIPIGVFSARRKGTTADGIISTILFMLYSLPNFWVATLLIIFLCQPAYLDIFPAFGLGHVPDDATIFEAFGIRAYHLILPLFCWTYPSLAFLSRQMRGGMLTVLRQDYIRTARAKGLTETKVIWKHSFRNSLLPIITLFANVFPLMISGSIVIEFIFGIPGMGNTLFSAILFKDFPMVFTVVMLAAILTMIGYLIADILYAMVDPRIRY